MSYTINHISYAQNELLDEAQRILQSGAPKWEKDVWTFIAVWFDDKETVQLKTSGSTGEPKVIDVEKKYLRNSARMTLDFLNLKKGNTALLCLSAQYIAGKMMIVRAFEGDLDLLIQEPSGNPLKSCNEKLKFVALVPLQVERMLNENGVEAVERIDQIIIGGAAVGGQLLQQIKGLENMVWATYGMTETVSHVAMKRLSGECVSDYFYPMTGVTFSADERGCLQIDAPHLCADRVVTNDIVEFDKNNGFRFIGRYDNVINSGGVKISPESVEQKITHFIKERFIISSVEDEHLGQKVVLIIEGKSECFDKNELLSIIKTVLLPYECPKDVYFVGAFEETGSGKVRR